ncbi:tRNA (guanosine(37)-N1)-methyltransferase TrmD [bacterium]|nr:tRNA (guanosine(37)-N1)-methyltransferase TrmD [bacterium]
MEFHIFTLFPEFFESPLKTSILGKAVESGKVKVKTHNFREFATNKHKNADDYPFGGGAGMILKAEPIFRCYENLVQGKKNEFYTIFLTPTGRVFNQKIAHELTHKQKIIFICGHYKGVDQRVIDELVDEEISLGDFVLTGGEFPSLAIIDAVTRLLPEVIGNIESANTDSFENGLLDVPHYTRPADFRGLKVPEVLLSGHHKNIEKWKSEKSLEKTKKVRPDLLDKF